MAGPSISDASIAAGAAALATGSGVSNMSSSTWVAGTSPGGGAVAR